MSKGFYKKGNRKRSKKVVSFLGCFAVFWRVSQQGGFKKPLTFWPKDMT
jgi:hypothetical protein